MGRVEQRRAGVIDAIFAAATEVMAEGGAASLSLGEVARRLGMRTPSLYGYFDSRAALCDEVFRRGWLSYAQTTADLHVTATTDFRALLRDGILESVRWANDNRAAAELMFWRPIPHWQPSADAFAPAIRAVGQTVQLLHEARAVGLLRADADVTEMSELLGVIVAGVISQQLSNEPGVPPEEGRISCHADAFADLFTSRYATQPGSRP